MMNLHYSLKILRNSQKKWASHLSPIHHFPKYSKVKILLKTKIFLIIKREFNVGNVRFGAHLIRVCKHSEKEIQDQEINIA